MRLLCALLVVVAFASCSDGVQRGQFSVTRSESTPIAPLPGYVSVFSGYRLNADGSSAGQSQDLLFLLVICPDADRREVGTEQKNDSFISTFTYTFGKRKISIPWDRRSDTLRVGGKEFHRDKGNVLVVRCGSSGQIIPQQLSSITQTALVRADDVIRHTRLQMPNDEIVASIHL